MEGFRTSISVVKLFYQHFVKRGLDIALSLVGIVVLSPLIVMLSFLLCIATQGSPFFLQRRPGKLQRPFSIIKFKTMRSPFDKNGKRLSVNERITPMGRNLRKLSLDEIPQLFNVLKGDMSIVGPRPLLFDYIPLYTEEQLRRHEMKPGITGWAQVNGRNSISWEEKFTLDVYYVDHVSFLLDLRIIGLTVQKVAKREGINQNEATTMQAFSGTNKIR